MVGGYKHRTPSITIDSPAEKANLPITKIDISYLLGELKRTDKSEISYGRSA